MARFLIRNKRSSMRHRKAICKCVILCVVSGSKRHEDFLYKNAAPPVGENA